MPARDLASLAGEETIFGEFAAEKLKCLQAELKPLSRRYDVVVANPPYMGSSNMNGWVSKWVKSNYPTAKSDLCTCFFERGQVLAEAIGYISMITASSWMFISSFEKFRKRLLSRGSICSMIQQSTHGYAGVTVPTTMFVYACNRSGVIGSYIRLEDFDRPQWQEPRALEALANPNCGWFYRADADGFGVIPGSPIAYWASKSLLKSFKRFSPLESFVPSKSGLTTGDNERFLRCWWECSEANQSSTISCRAAAKQSKIKWVPCNKGGEYRKWYGNNDYVVNWKNDGGEMKSAGLSATMYRNSSFYFREGITWSSISSSKFHIRYSPEGRIPERKGATAYSDDKKLLINALAALNSSSCSALFAVLAPTLDYSEGPVSRIPMPTDYSQLENVLKMARNNIRTSRLDWDAFEVSHDFKKHPLCR